ncbi:MAG: 2Fe-2S iron-sulfur cluster binding domain-containing protein, partial [Candidatus Latescibacteria bacterium]|nr:2Fe-2S iron-sulfur cluster binding domain-containing protein [Candidatus Latescibacterota bacterium]
MRGNEKMGRIFFPQYRRTRQGMEISKGKSILDYAREFGVSIDAECGGQGECGKCVVRIDRGGE